MSTNTLTVILQAVDNMSGIVNGALSNVSSKLDGWAKSYKNFATQAQNVSQSSAFAAMAVGAAMAHPLKKFSEYDQALAGLKTSMMDVNGVVNEQLLGSMDKYARELGNKFKGNQADMLAMFYELSTSGVEAHQILNGLGEATAQYATLTHQSYESVGKSFAKLSNEMGITNKALYPTDSAQHDAYISFADSLQRAHYLGVKPDDMLYALGRSAGGMKLLQQQGAEAFKTLVPFYTMLIRGGATGEKAGTNAVAAALNIIDPTRIDKANKALKGMGENFQLAFLDKDGNIPKGENFIRSFYEQAQKLQGLSVKEQGIIGKLLMGGGFDQQIWQQMVSMGVKGYDELSQAMARQADIAKKNAEIQRTLGNTFENTMSMFENLEIDWVKTFSNDLKGLLTDRVQPFIEGMQTWMGHHQELARAVGLGGLAFIGLSAATAIASGGIYVIVKSISNLLSIASGAIGAVQKLGQFIGILKPLKEGVTAGSAFKDLFKAGLSLVKNPYVLAFMAVGAAAVYAYNHSEKLRKTLYDSLPFLNPEKYSDFVGPSQESRWDRFQRRLQMIPEGINRVRSAYAEWTGHQNRTGFVGPKALEGKGLAPPEQLTTWQKIGRGWGEFVDGYSAKVAKLREAHEKHERGYLLSPRAEKGFQDIFGGMKSPKGMEFKLPQIDWSKHLQTLKEGIPSMSSIKQLGTNFMGNLGQLKMPELKMPAFKMPEFQGMKEFINGFKKAPQEIAQAMSAMKNSLSGMKSLVGSNLKNAFSGIGEAISSALSRAGSQIMAWVSSTRARMVSGIASIRASVASAFNGISTAISGAFSRASAVVSAFVSSARAKLVGGFQQIAASAGAAASAIAARLQAAFNSALAAAGSFVSGVIAKLNSMYSQVMALAGRMFAAGRRIVENIARGISSGIGMVTAAIGKVAAAIMSHMPRSPAKEGPLRDIQKINIVGTIAETMRPAPIVKASEKVALATKNSLNRNLSLVHSKGRSGHTTHHYSPTINVAGNSPDIRSEVDAALKVAFKQYARKQTLNYAS